MVKFPSEEWVKAFKDALNKSKEYATAAKNWEGDFVCIVEPDDGKGKEFVLH